MRNSPGHAFLASFNRNTARKRYPYCQGYNGFWSVVHPVEYAQIRHGRKFVMGAIASSPRAAPLSCTSVAVSR